MKEHEHHHKHHHHEHYENTLGQSEKILTVRALSGLSGDIILCGLAKMSNISDSDLQSLIQDLKLSALCQDENKKSVSIVHKSINEISGFHAEISLPHEHAHRTLSDIIHIINQSTLTKNAKKLSIKTFTLLAKAEAKVHSKSETDVTFHEVGALDSILDICISCALFDLIKTDHFICSPLPIADGSIYCAHGHIPSPAPAVLELLEDIPVCSFNDSGETITPTAIALLKALDAKFGKWPCMTIENKAIVYGTKTFKNTANGAIWAFGTGHTIG